MNNNFDNLRVVHFIGVGGIGISAVARMFLLDGKKVSGSDASENEVTKALREAGAVVTIGENAKNIPADADLVIYTIAVMKEHVELAEAKRRGIFILSYPEALGIISKNKYAIVIAGTHGKTTTTAMVAKILMDAGLDPTVIVGSFLLDAEQTLDRGNAEPRRTNFVAGKSRYLVVEGCEYRRSFLNLSPKILVITNIDADHLDYYRDMQDIISAFAELSRKLPRDGYLILNSRAPNVETIAEGSPCLNIDFSAFKFPAGFKLRIPGAHNFLNAKAALAVARALKIPEEQALSSLLEFRGTWRRFEYRGKAKNGALVYDDYGHHPTEIEATFQGARELFPSQKIITIFQPHLYSRTKQHLAEFGRAFKETSSVILLPIYPSREKDPGDINSQMVVDEIRKNGKDARFVETFGEAAALAQTISGPGDIIITLGAGETNKIADILVV